jgi:hypothetical protein
LIRVSFAAVRSAAATGFLLSFVACGGTSEPASGGTITGSYDTRWTRSAASCSPAVLPAPTESNLSSYLIPPTRDSSWTSKVDVGIADTSFTFTVSDASGVKDPLGAYVGDTEVGPGVATRIRGPITEGLRGTHRFSATATTQFNYFLQPVGTKFSLQVSSTTTYQYREPDANGPVFTTCTARDMGSASR